eukprot:355986-Chlamydomonas_euryale.AAC.18
MSPIDRGDEQLPGVERLERVPHFIKRVGLGAGANALGAAHDDVLLVGHERDCGIPATPAHVGDLAGMQCGVGKGGERQRFQRAHHVWAAEGHGKGRGSSVRVTCGLQKDRGKVGCGVINNGHGEKHRLTVSDPRLEACNWLNCFQPFLIWPTLFLSLLPSSCVYPGLAPLLLPCQIMQEIGWFEEHPVLVCTN